MARLNPTDEDDRRLAFDCYATFNDARADWWTCHVFRLCSKADPSNLARMVLSFDREVLMYQEWQRMSQDAFRKKWGIPDPRDEEPVTDDDPLPG